MCYPDEEKFSPVFVMVFILALIFGIILTPIAIVLGTLLGGIFGATIGLFKFTTYLWVTIIEDMFKYFDVEMKLND